MKCINNSIGCLLVEWLRQTTAWWTETKKEGSRENVQEDRWSLVWGEMWRNMSQQQGRNSYLHHDQTGKVMLFLSSAGRWWYPSLHVTYTCDKISLLYQFERPIYDQITKIEESQIYFNIVTLMIFWFLTHEQTIWKLVIGTLVCLNIALQAPAYTYSYCRSKDHGRKFGKSITSKRFTSKISYFRQKYR